jgi:hypothetical protein
MDTKFEDRVRDKVIRDLREIISKQKTEHEELNNKFVELEDKYNIMDYNYTALVNERYDEDECIAAALDLSITGTELSRSVGNSNN